MKLLKYKENHNPYGLQRDCGIPLTRDETIAYFRSIRVTKDELADLNEWIKAGNTFYHNPWLILNEKGVSVNFIVASRSINELYEEHTHQWLIPSTPFTDCAFIVDCAPF